MATFKTLPTGVMRGDFRDVYPLIDGDNLPVGFSSSKGDNFIANLAIDPITGGVTGLTVPTGGTIDITEKTNNSRNARIAAFNAGPLIAPPARVNSAVMTAGTAMKWSDGTAVVVTTGGTLAAAEPTGLTDGRPLTDGTAVLYHTAWNVAANAIAAPTVTQILSSALAANGLTEVDVATVGAGVQYVSSADALLYSSGGNFVAAISMSHSDNVAIAGNKRSDYLLDPAPAVVLGGTTALAPGFVDIEFYVEDTKFAITYHNFGGTCFIYVDGQPLAPFQTAVTAGNYLLFDFNGVMKKRKISMNTATGDTVNLRGVAITPQGNITAVTDRIGDNLLVIGDSFTNTSSPETGMRHASDYIKRYLGFEGVSNMGLGGTGYVTQGIGPLYNHLQVLQNNNNQQLINYFAPKHVLFYTGTNDVNGTTAANSVAGMNACFDVVRTLLPTAKISVVDCTLGSAQAANTTHFAMAAAVKNAVALRADSNIRVIELLGTSTSTAVVRGTGQISTALGAGTGNASYFHGNDGTHPGPAGHRYRARRIADEMKRVWYGNY